MDIDCAELKRLAIAAQNDCGDYVALNDYGMAMPPAVCLALIAENDRLERNRDMWKGQVERQAEELTDLRKDAERYRWLRDTDNQECLEPDSDYLMPPIICGYAEHEDILSMEALDKAIDEAMSEVAKP